MLRTEHVGPKPIKSGCWQVAEESIRVEHFHNQSEVTVELENRHTLTGIGGSNPSLSAIQSELQRKLAVFLRKPAIIAAILRIFAANRTRETSSIAFIYPGFQLFSPRADLAVRFRLIT